MYSKSALRAHTQTMAEALPGCETTAAKAASFCGWVVPRSRPIAVPRLAPSVFHGALRMAAGPVSAHKTQNAQWCKPTLRTVFALPSFLPARAGAARKHLKEGPSPGVVKMSGVLSARPLPPLGATKSIIKAPQVSLHASQRPAPPAGVVSSTRLGLGRVQPAEWGW